VLIWPLSAHMQVLPTLKTPKEYGSALHGLPWLFLDQTKIVTCDFRTWSQAQKVFL
jgi:hypothetical protein